ncbi:MurR/RpiR family transcriptional regulator [Vogesella indigofera]|uniref:MurR/RpiR family transcriptional regulator n=1 Tax=Vogesella indigofera TaxID=45465 RepID=UPI00234EE1E5|nr:MurR/RpiR family transcriptional regulator [Vogesella indigofera]MDC7699677.1 MurR/RpiR family transcriptional regulator [Vogesella indigofera]MDC7707761.1 MurR/RpiR family transcriptional regulator [Vogesella indigofera]
MQRISEEYEGLSKQLKVIAKYIEEHRPTLVLERITDIAQACEVQPSAIVRFAQRFGFSGFSDMQALFRDSFAPAQGNVNNYQKRIRTVIASQNTPLSNTELTQSFLSACQQGLEELSQSLDPAAIDAAVELLYKAENIYVVGVRRMFPIASYVCYALQHTQKRVHLISGLGGMYHDQVRSIRENDLMIAISFQPYGRETRYCARVAAQNKAKLLVISDSKMSPLARNASTVLTVKEGTAFAFRSMSSTISLCQALFIALSYRLELVIEETQDAGAYDD